MKRKLAVALATVFVLVITVSAAYAATDKEDYFNRMFNAHKQWVSQAVENKQLTPEQGQAWNSHFEQMRKFHETNGFGCPGFGMMGGFTNNNQLNSTE